jgi:hypothetical protein
MVEEFKGAMMKEFEMTDLRLMKYFLGLEVKQHKKDIFCLTRSICEGDSKNIRDGELQSNNDTDGARYKAFSI